MESIDAMLALASYTVRVKATKPTHSHEWVNCEVGRYDLTQHLSCLARWLCSWCVGCIMDSVLRDLEKYREYSRFEF